MSKHSPSRQQSWEVRESLSKFSGRVLHVMKDNNLLRFRVDSSGQVLLEKLEEVRGVAKSRLRKAVTGDPEKKIRDYMTEVPQVKFIDKLSFFLGVSCIVILEFLALRQPAYFTQFYYLIMTGLLTNRYFQYTEEKYQYFMLDFCYFINVSVAIQTGLYPHCLTWYKANYVLSMGVLMLAIVVWQNSLVFHSLDKLTSILIHAMPGLTLHLYRWGLIPNPAIRTEDSLSPPEVFIWPMLLYSIWQVVYLILTEVIFAYRFREDPDLTSSLRYLAKDKKNGMHQLVLGLTRKIGILSPKEEFNADTMKTKLIFVVSQFVYTIFTLLITPLLYSSYTLSLLYIVGIFGWCIWRGGTYYIEVFSEKYKLKFIKAEETSTQEKEAEDTEDTEDPDLYQELYAALQQATNSIKESEI